jgi:hypothetical protein
LEEQNAVAKIDDILAPRATIAIQRMTGFLRGPKKTIRRTRQIMQAIMSANRITLGRMYADKGTIIIVVVIFSQELDQTTFEEEKKTLSTKCQTTKCQSSPKKAELR